jgi:putative flippase GtrA
VRDDDPSTGLRRFLRFIVVGLFNTAFGYAVFAALLYLGLSSSVALLLATIVGVIFNFFTTGRIVFNSRERRLLPRFVFAYVVTFSANLVMLKTLESYAVPPLGAQALCLPPTVLLSFYILRKFVFRTVPQ